MYKLYSKPGSCSTAITILLTVLDVEFEIIHQNTVENYADIVPTNQVPALQTDDKIIVEGSAIVLYLLEKHNSDMLPTNIEEKVDFLQWLMFCYATLHPAYSKIIAVSHIIDDEKEKHVIAQKLADKLSDKWAIVNNHLSDKEFMFGDKPTIIDYLITVYSTWASFMPEVHIQLGENTERLINKVKSLAEFKLAYKKEGIDL